MIRIIDWEEWRLRLSPAGMSMRHRRRERFCPFQVLIWGKAFVASKEIPTFAYFFSLAHCLLRGRYPTPNSLSFASLLTASEVLFTIT
jgi:hypothetical protein